MAVLYTPHFVQFEDSDGNPLSGGKLYSYAAGTTTNKATFTTAAGDIQNPNPVILDSAGRAVIFIEGSYRFDLFDANDDLIKSVDNVTSFTTLPTSNNALFDTFSGDGTNTAFTLSQDVGTDEKALIVYVDNSNLEYSVNGTFATDSDWTKGSGWTITGGEAVASTASTALSQSAGYNIVEGVAYIVTFTMTRSAGSVVVSVGGTDGTSRSSGGTYSEIIIAGSSQTIAFTGTGFTGTIDNVSVKLANGKGYEVQNPNSFTISGTALTLTSPPAIGTNNVFVIAPSLLTGAASAAAAAAEAAAAGALAAQAEAEAAAGITEVTSTTSVAIGTGSKTFTVGTGLFLAAGQFIHITSDADPETNSMWGTVTSYSGSTLQVNVEVTRGSGTYADWTMRLTGERGETGATSSISDLSGVPSGTPALEDTLIFTDVNDSNTTKKFSLSSSLFSAAIGQGVQVRDDSGSPKAFPASGGFIDINGTLMAVPAAGVSFSGSPSNDTTYYLYLYDNSGTLSGEISATGYTLDSDTGLPYQTGDATRRLVGMARYETGAWATSDNLVRSYYNDEGFVVSNAFTALRSTTSTSYVEVNSEIRCEFLAWADETIDVILNGSHINTTANKVTTTSLAFDGTIKEDLHTDYAAYGNGAARCNCGLHLAKTGLSEGYHYATVIGKVGGGTGRWQGDASASNERATLRVKGKR